MGCLSDETTPIVSVRENCTDVVPSSGLYLNDLEGMSIELGDSISSKDYKGALDLFQKKLELAESHMRNDVNTMLAQYVRQDSLINFDSIGIALDNKVAVASAANTLKGVKIDIQRTSYMELYVHQVGLWADTVITTNIEVWDLISGLKLDDLPITTVAGQITQVQVNKTYKTNKQKLHLAFIYDASLTGTYNTSLHPDICTGCRKNAGYINYYTHISGVQITDSATKIAQNFTGTSGTSGVFIDYSLSCSAENFLCNNANSFALPLLYKWAELVIREAVFSNRINSYVTLNADLNKDLEVDFKTLYEEKIKALTTNMKVPANDICFSCSPLVSTRTEIPM